MKTIEGTFGGEIQIFEEANVYVILDNSTIYLLPKEKKPVCFYEPPDNYKIQEDGTLVISKTNVIKTGD